jgi:hypothetical protein
MKIDPTNPVVALCAAGMAIEGDADAAKRLFEQAWTARQDDYEASIAAHFLARHKPTAEARVHWNALAARHAESVTDGRTDGFKASLYLNLADALLAAGDHAAASDALARAVDGVSYLPPDGYRTFVERGIAGVQLRLAEAQEATTLVEHDAHRRGIALHDAGRTDGARTRDAEAEDSSDHTVGERARE